MVEDRHENTKFATKSVSMVTWTLQCNDMFLLAETSKVLWQMIFWLPRQHPLPAAARAEEKMCKFFLSFYSNDYNLTAVT